MFGWNNVTSCNIYILANIITAFNIVRVNVKQAPASHAYNVATIQA